MARQKRWDGAVVAAAAKRYWRESDARVVVDAWRRSGQTLGDFATGLHVPRQRVARWAGRLDESAPGERAGHEDGGDSGRACPAEVGFHPVRMVADDRRPGRRKAIEVVLGRGLRVRVPEGFASEELARVLAVLEGCAAC